MICATTLVLCATLALPNDAGADDGAAASERANPADPVDNTGLKDVERHGDHALAAGRCEERWLVSDVLKDVGHQLQLEVTELTSPSVSDAEERKLGELVEASMMSMMRNGSSRDEVYLNALLDDLMVFAERDLEYRVRVMDSYAPNAFALPGGLIMVSTGLLDRIENEAQLVGVLAHELGHHELRHVIGHVQYLKMLGIWDPSGLEQGQMPSAMRTMTTLQLPFQSRLEQAADNYGLELVARLGYSPHQVAELMQIFAEIDGRRDFDAGDSFASVLIPETTNLIESHPRGMPRACAIRRRIELRWDTSSETPLYLGERNYQERTPRSQKAY